MSEFSSHLSASLDRHRLLPRGRRILVAVSGGVDSMVLLRALHRLAAPMRWKISVAHFNHQLRGRASDADERLVGAAAEKLTLPFFCGRDDVRTFARRAKISTEMAARRLRHEFLARVAREQKITVVALAHHADDQIELCFLRLLRGAGGDGMGGMKRRSPSPADAKISLVRPLLDFSKAELRDFAREQKIRFREDATNVSTDFLRNRIRNELLPLLRKKYQPGLDKVILRFMDIVGAEAEFVADAATQIRNPQSAIRNSFARWPLAIQRRALRQQLAARGWPPDFELVEQLRESPGRRVSAGAGWAVQRDATGKISFKEQTPAEFNPVELTIELTGNAGRVVFGGREFAWRISRQTKLEPFKNKRADKRRTGREYFDADKIGGRITLRHWRPGDRFQLIGMKAAVKLQDLFVNAKIPAAHRRKLILATAAAGEIFWVERLRIGENFKLTPKTARRLAWEQPKFAV